MVCTEWSAPGGNYLELFVAVHPRVLVLMLLGRLIWVIKIGAGSTGYQHRLRCVEIAEVSVPEVWESDG